VSDQAAHVLSWLIDAGTWETAADVARWQKKHSAVASPSLVYRLAALNYGDPDVALALTLGMIKRAHLNLDRTAGTRPHEYVCVHDDATILNSRKPALCAALAIWLMGNPSARGGNM
jgi:hypothetical protein